MRGVSSLVNHPTRRDYVPPPRDKTVVKVKIVSRCWLKTSEAAAMQTVAAGEIVQLERWIADELRLGGRADLL